MSLPGRALAARSRHVDALKRSGLTDMIWPVNRCACASGRKVPLRIISKHMTSSCEVDTCGIVKCENIKGHYDSGPLIDTLEIAYIEHSCAVSEQCCRWSVHWRPMQGEEPYSIRIVGTASVVVYI